MANSHQKFDGKSKQQSEEKVKTPSPSTSSASSSSAASSIIFKSISIQRLPSLKSQSSAYDPDNISGLLIEDLWREKSPLFGFFDDETKTELSRVNWFKDQKAYQPFLKLPTMHEKELLKKLMLHVLSNEKAQGEAILKECPELITKEYRLNYTDSEIDSNSRIFEGTPYQFSLRRFFETFSYDESMAEMIKSDFIKCFNNDEYAANQELKKQQDELFPNKAHTINLRLEELSKYWDTQLVYCRDGTGHWTLMSWFDEDTNEWVEHYDDDKVRKLREFYHHRKDAINHIFDREMTPQEKITQEIDFLSRKGYTWDSKESLDCPRLSGETLIRKLRWKILSDLLDLINKYNDSESLLKAIEEWKIIALNEIWGKLGQGAKDRLIEICESQKKSLTNYGILSIHRSIIKPSQTHTQQIVDDIVASLQKTVMRQKPVTEKETHKTEEKKASTPISVSSANSLSSSSSSLLAGSSSLFSVSVSQIDIIKTAIINNIKNDIKRIQFKYGWKDEDRLEFKNLDKTQLIYKFKWNIYKDLIDFIDQVKNPNADDIERWKNQTPYQLDFWKKLNEADQDKISSRCPAMTNYAILSIHVGAKRFSIFRSKDQPQTASQTIIDEIVSSLKKKPAPK